MEERKKSGREKKSICTPRRSRDSSDDRQTPATAAARMTTESEATATSTSRQRRAPSIRVSSMTNERRQAVLAKAMFSTEKPMGNKRVP